MQSGSAVRPETDVSLAELTTLHVGGRARWFVRAESSVSVATVCQWCDEQEIPLLVLGGGSNLVIADEGFNGCVLHVAIRGVSFTADGSDTVLVAGAGETWDPIVAASVARDLGGIECLSGIPGSVGGTPIQNVGAYGQEVADTLQWVGVYDRARGLVERLDAADCEFSYRMSRFKGRDAGRFVVCEVAFRLRAAVTPPTYPDIVAHLDHAGIVAPAVGDIRQAVLAVRRRKGMVLDPADGDTRSVGSFFMNPVVSEFERARIGATVREPVPGFVLTDEMVKVSAAWLIERSGFRKGDSDGAVGISTKHPLALVNRGGATARDVLRLAVRIKRAVLDRFGIALRPEPVFVGFERNADLDFLLTS